MKLVASRSELLRALSFCAHATDPKAPAFAAKCALLRVTTKDTAEVSTFDGHMSARAIIGVQSGVKGSFGLPAVDLLERVKAMPEGSDVTIAVETGSAAPKATMTSGKRKHTLRAIPGEDVPLPEPAKLGNAFTIPGQLLVRALDHTAYAMNLDPSGGKYHGTFLRFDNSQIRSDASDGHKMATFVAAFANGSGEPICIDVKFAATLRKVTAETVRLAFDSNRIRVDIGSNTLESPLRPDVFPGDQAFPDPAAHVRVDRSALKASIRAVEPAATDAQHWADFIADGGVLTLKSAGDSGDGEDEIPCDGAQSFVVRLNIGYVLAALDQIEGDDVDICYNGGDFDPVHMRPSKLADGVEKSRHIIMPVKR